MDLTWAYLLIVLGMAMLAGEMFFPTGGILFLCGSIGIAAGIVMSFYYGDTSTGLLTLVGVFLTGPAAGYALLQIWPKTSIGKQMVRVADDDATLATSPALLELEALRGRIGKTLSELRPSGAVSFDGKRIDVQSEGPFVPAEVWVKCIDIRAGRVIVRRVEAPNLDSINFEDVPV
ncbi:MAG: hypothetical protein K1X57_15900 [Gemmataceae bacterium]|nr:hypothetical protein [Gemmataceae bacterium]